MDTNWETARKALCAVAERGATVRPVVIASWQRSMHHQVNASTLDVPFVSDVDIDTPLVRAATPVLEGLHEQLSTEPIATMLTDHDGLVLQRKVSHEGLTTRLNKVQLAPGHVFAEQHVGTNGIGTALELAEPTVISGAEHYVEDLRYFHCAAVPILHPTRRTVVGAFNLTALASSTSGPMALALATSTASQIERELALISSHREYLLFERYLGTCRIERHMPVLAFNGDVVMMNDRLRATITGADQVSLLAMAREYAEHPAGASGRRLTLPSGAGVELRTAPAEDADGGGHVVVVRPLGRTKGSSSARDRRRIPGLVGEDPAWLRAVADFQNAYDRRDLTCLLGEPGTGKVSLVAAIGLFNHGPAARVMESPVGQDADDWLNVVRRNLADPADLVILRNVHLLSPAVRIRLVDLLSDSDTAAHARVAITANPDALAPEDELIALCTRELELPALRHRQADISRLLRFLIHRYHHVDGTVLTPAAEHALQRCAWPENIRQLGQVARHLGKRAALGAIDISDLPPDALATHRSRLTPLEELERDAIIKGLIAHDRNVLQTAEDLGISRATIYRKMRRYGIDPASV